MNTFDAAVYCSSHEAFLRLMFGMSSSRSIRLKKIGLINFINSRHLFEPKILNLLEYFEAHVHFLNQLR